MKQFAAVLLLALGVASHASAQSFLDELRENKSGEGTVTVNQSVAIDELVNKEKLTITPPATQQPKQQQTKPQQSAKETVVREKEPIIEEPKREIAVEETVRSNRSSEEPIIEESRTETTIASNSKKVMRNSKKIKGYRVQAYSGGNSGADKRKAESVGNAIKMRMPDMPVYVHFYSPRWICRVGNFRTYEEANNVLKEIKDMGYKQACIVKGTISVAY